jgi:hypothetical protein
MIQLGDCVEEREPRAHRPLGIIFMCLRVAEINEQAIAQVLGDVATEAGDCLGGGVMILPNDLAPVLRIELPGDGGRPNEVAEENGELPPLALRRRPYNRDATVAAEPLADLV